MMDENDETLLRFRREVEEVLALARSAHQGPPAAAVTPPEIRAERARLEVLLEDLRRRSRSQTAELEAERLERGKEIARLEETRAQLRALQERCSASSLETAAAQARARELEETLRVTAQARLHAVTALQESVRQLESWTAQAGLLKSRLDSMEPAFAAKDAELKAAQERYERSCRERDAEVLLHHQESQRLSEEVRNAKAHEAEVMIRLEQQRRGLDLEREHLLARSKEAAEAAELARREGDEALKAARELGQVLEPASQEAERAKRRAEFEAERGRLFAELEEERARQRKKLEAELAARGVMGDTAKAVSPAGETAAAAPPPAIRRSDPRPSLEAGPLGGGGRVRAVLFSVLALALSVGGAVWSLRPSYRRYPVPFANPTALVWAGDDLWAADWRQEAIYRLRLHEGVLNVVKRWHLPGIHITGLAVAGEALYLSDSWKREILRFKVGKPLPVGEGGGTPAPGTPDAGKDLVLEATWPSPGENPTALYWDGAYLWSADSPHRIYQHALDESLTVLNAYPAGFQVAAIHAAVDRFWTADADRRVITRHRRDAVLSPIEVLGSAFLDGGTDPLSAFARRGDRVWLGRERTGFLVETAESRLGRRAGR